MKRKKKVNLPEEEQSVGEFVQTTFNGPLIKNSDGFTAIKDYFGGRNSVVITGKSMKELVTKLVLSDMLPDH